MVSYHETSRQIEMSTGGLKGVIGGRLDIFGRWNKDKITKQKTTNLCLNAGKILLGWYASFYLQKSYRNEWKEVTSSVEWVDLKNAIKSLGVKLHPRATQKLNNQNNYSLKCLDGVIMHKNLNDSHLFLCGIGIADEHNLVDKIS